MNELRDFGDKRTVVVYTDDRQFANRLMARKRCLKSIPYEQGDKLVGLDFYFPKSERKNLIRMGVEEC